MADAYYNSRSSEGAWGSDVLINAGFNYPCGIEDWSGVVWAVAWDEANKDGDDKASIHLFKSIDQGANWSDLGVVVSDVLGQVCGIETEII